MAAIMLACGSAAPGFAQCYVEIRADGRGHAGALNDVTSEILNGLGAF